MTYQHNPTPDPQRIVFDPTGNRSSRFSIPGPRMTFPELCEYVGATRHPGTSSNAPAPAFIAAPAFVFTAPPAPQQAPRRRRRRQRWPRSRDSRRPNFATTTAMLEFESERAMVNLPASLPVVSSSMYGANSIPARFVQFGSRSLSFIPAGPVNSQSKVPFKSTLSATAKEFIPASPRLSATAQEFVPMNETHECLNTYNVGNAGYTREQVWYPTLDFQTQALADQYQRGEYFTQGLASPGIDTASLWKQAQEQIALDMFYEGHSPASIQHYLGLVGTVASSEATTEVEFAEEHAPVAYTYTMADHREETAPAANPGRAWDMATMQWEDEM